jgi:non-ribosomal peptide synthetase component F
MGAQRAGTVTDGLRSARDLLLEQRNDLEAARVGFSWPRFEHLNWALDWFDAVARRPETAGRDALVVVEQDGAVQRRTYAELSRRSGQVANWLRSLGVRRHDRVLLMLGNQVELWEALLAAIKLGAVVVPATTLLTTEDLRDRVERGALSCVVARGEDTAKFADIHGDFGRIAVAGGATGDAGSPAGWTDYAESLQAVETFEPDGPTPADDPMLLYFTSGTTAKPKLVLHTHQSSRRCTGSACSREICTATSPPRGGRSTPGAACSRPSTPRPPSSCTIQAGSLPRSCSTSSPITPSRPCARRPRSGACSCSRTSPPGRSLCARWWRPASRSTPR